MADYRLTQTGDQVQSLLNQVTPNQQAIEGLQSDKVDKVEGKGLSDENFTESEKTKLGNLPTQSELNTELGKKATIVSLGEEAQARQQADNTLQGNIDTINGKIPAAASAQNKLVDEQKMNSSIATETATYRGSYNLVTDLHLTISATESDIANALAVAIVAADNNDYCYVQIPVANDKPTEIARVDRYKFNGTVWVLEYTLNNSGFTAAQWDAINSGITSGLVAKLNALPNNAELIALLAAKAPQATTYTKSEVDALIANFITASVNNLVNYYLKSDTYTKAEVQQLIDSVKQFTYISVAELPTASADTMNKIYLVPSTNPETQNVKDEYITISATDQGLTTYSWEQIGSTTVDLSGYYTSAQTDAAITAALASYATTSAMNTAIAAALVNYYTKTEIDAALLLKQDVISDLSSIRAGAAAGAISAPQATTYTKNEVDALIANFITASVNNLVNYYLKTDTYNAMEIDQMLAAIRQFQYEAVQTLPTASASTVGKIYLVPNADPTAQNKKDEYITLTITEESTTTYEWECIGSTDIDLTNYYTKSQADAAITSAINQALASYSTTAQVSTMISTAINSALAAYATKEYVASQVQEYAGTFRGTYNTLADLEATTGNHHNDYAWVKVTDSDGDNDYDRYKYNGTEWVFEYRLNNTHFTAAELSSIRSGMTTEKRQKLDALPTNAELTTKLNALTRRTRLTDFDLATLKLAVADQNLEKYGLKVGDYKTINGHDYVIAGLNPMKGTSTPYRLTANHVGLIVIPHTTQAWNASGNTYTGADSRGAGYANSDLHYYLVNTLLPLVKTDLGAANLLAHSKLLSNAVNQNGINRYGEATGCSSGWGWVADQYISALSEVQVYGSVVWSSSGFDTGEACRQLDVFRHFNHTEIFGSEYPWLRDVVSASYAAIADITGYANNYTASYAIYVAALILFN